MPNGPVSSKRREEGTKLDGQIHQSDESVNQSLRLSSQVYAKSVAKIVHGNGLLIRHQRCYLGTECVTPQYVVASRVESSGSMSDHRFAALQKYGVRIMSYWGDLMSWID